MKKLMIITLALLTFSNISMAVPKPDVCPGADAIRATPLAAAIEIDDDLYTVYSQNNFGTEQQWAFFIARIQAKSESEALSKAREALAGLNGSPTPQKSFVEYEWECLYNLTNEDYIATALYPYDILPVKKITNLLKARK